MLLKNVTMSDSFSYNICVNGLKGWEKVLSVEGCGFESCHEWFLFFCSFLRTCFKLMFKICKIRPAMSFNVSIQLINHLYIAFCLNLKIIN